MHGLSFVGSPQSPIIDEEPWVLEIPGLEENRGDVTRIRIVWGDTSGQIYWTVSAPYGLDNVGLHLVKMRVEEEAAKRGYHVEEWDVLQVGYNFDDVDVQLDGLKSLTFKDVSGNLERYYQKAYGIRSEVHLNQKTSLDEVMAAVQGGLPAYNIVQSNLILQKTVQDFLEFERYRSSQIGQLIEGLNSLNRALFRVLDKNG